MPRTITPLVRQKMQAAKEARRDVSRRQCLRVGAWIVYRLDPLNLVLERASGDDRSYYPTIGSALAALLDRRIEERAGPTLETVLQAVREAKAEVLAACCDGIVL